MKAAVMTAAGAPEVLQIQDVPTPELKSNHDVLVRLRAAAINPADYKRRASGAGVKLPAILGFDGAGVVEKIGRAVTRFKVGDEVYLLQNGLGVGPGCYAQYTVLHEDLIAFKPKRLSMIEAAAVPLVLITIWEALFDRGNLKAGQTVLVHAGAGGTGHVAIQLARNAGARVATTVSGPEKAAWAKQLGAELTIDYKREDFVQAALDWTEGCGVDMVLDTVGGENFAKSFPAAKVYGQVITLLRTPYGQDAANVAGTRNLAIKYVLMLTPMMLNMHAAWKNQRIMLDNAACMIDDGKLNVKVGHTFPLEAVASAHRLIEEGHTSGKIVLTID
jgi:NADPH:quinone reductase